MVLLCPRLREHADSCREPSFRECAEHAAALAVHVDLVLEKLEHLDLGLLSSRIESELLRVCLEGLLVRGDEGDCVWVLAVVEERAVDVLRALDKVLLDSLRRILLAVSRDEQRLETSYDVKHLGVTHVSHVSGMEPSVHDSVGSRLRVLPVAGHHVLTLDADLALRAVWLLYTVCVEDLDLHRSHDLS